MVNYTLVTPDLDRKSVVKWGDVYIILPYYLFFYAAAVMLNYVLTLYSLIRSLIEIIACAMNI